MEQTTVIGVSIILFAVFSIIFNIAILIITLSIKKQIKQTKQVVGTTRLEESIGNVPSTEESIEESEPQQPTEKELKVERAAAMREAKKRKSEERKAEAKSKQEEEISKLMEQIQQIKNGAN